LPVGNQYFLTMNETCDHYQDTVAQYFIALWSGCCRLGGRHVGAGNADQTTYTDAGADGIANNRERPRPT
jgi:hypothetical protein